MGLGSGISDPGVKKALDPGSGIIILYRFGLVVRCVPHLRLPLSLSTARGAITTSLKLVNATARCRAEPKPDTEIDASRMHEK
jgi:hypothetical protein